MSLCFQIVSIATVGLKVGSIDGIDVVGTNVGLPGIGVGTADGVRVGLGEGDGVGDANGICVGVTDGAAVGWVVG